MRWFSLLLVVACSAELVPISVRLAPDDADTTDDLEATVHAEGAYRVSWWRDGERIEGITGTSLPRSLTARGDRVEVRVARGDAQASDALIVGNAPPAVQIQIGPEQPEAGDALVVAVVTHDPDGDLASIHYAWRRDGALFDALKGDRVPRGTTRRGERWAVEVHASDALVRGPTATAEVEIRNGRPQVVQARLDPDRPRTTDAIVVRAEAEDPDGDPVELHYAFYVDGTEVQAGPASVLPASMHARDEQITVRLTPSDPSTTGESVVLGPVRIENTAPTRPTARIVPRDPVAGAALRCVVEEPASDIDSDPLRYQARFTVDGEPFEGQTAIVEGDTVPARTTRGDEVWRCALAAFDGRDEGPAAEDEVVVSWPGFRASQSVLDAVVTCDEVVHTEHHTTCHGPRVDGLAPPNGLTCTTAWSSTPSPRTDHAGVCEAITGSRWFQADYGCGEIQDRAALVDGEWSVVRDNGYTAGLRCGW